MHDLTRVQVDQLVLDHAMHPAFVGQNPYIASGTTHEILVTIHANGLYQVELLDKKEMEQTLQQTIQAFKEYAAAAKF